MRGSGVFDHCQELQVGAERKRFHVSLVLEEMPEGEAIELVRNYARLYEAPITDDVAYAMATLCEGNPFYVSAVFDSDVHERDLMTRDGLLKILDIIANNILMQ